MTTTKSLFVAALLSVFAAASFAQRPTPPAGPQEHGARAHQMHKHHKHHKHHGHKRHHRHGQHRAHGNAHDHTR